MARAGASGSGGRINGRFMLLTIVCAGLSAILVYAGIARSSSDGGGEGGAAVTETATTVIAKTDISARTQITAVMVELREVPVEARAATALTSIDEAVGKVTRYPIALDEQVTPAKIVSVEGTENIEALSFAISKGSRAISIQADQVLSAGGLILPGDYVDIISVVDGTKPDGSVVENYVAKTILQNVQVLAVAQKIADSPSGDADASEEDPSGPDPEATTLTILVSPVQAELLFLAELNGTLRAVLRAYGDSDVTEVRPILQTELSPAVP